MEDLNFDKDVIWIIPTNNEKPIKLVIEASKEEMTEMIEEIFNVKNSSDNQ